jgi:hypothetical protein
MDPGAIPLAELLGPLGPVVSLIMAVAVMVILWEIAILIGVLIANRKPRDPFEEIRHC